MILAKLLSAEKDVIVVFGDVKKKDFFFEVVHEKNDYLTNIINGMEGISLGYSRYTVQRTEEANVYMRFYVWKQILYLPSKLANTMTKHVPK